MTPLAIFGLDVGGLVEDAVRALVDLVVPDFGSHWVSSLVTWLVALPPITSDGFPSLNRYAHDLTAVGFGLLGACFLGGLLQVWAGGTTGAAGVEAVRRAAIGAGALATYTTGLQALLIGVNTLTAEMIRHPLVVDGLDKAFGESLTVAAVTGGVSLGLAIGAAMVVLYFVAALFVLKIGLTALLAVGVVAGALVWGVYPLPQAQWLARAWVSGLAAAITVPVAWACIFAAAALLARDTLVFDGGGHFNAPLGDTLGYLVKPFAAVACFWIAYRAPYFLLGIARTAGLTATMLRGGGGTGRASAASRATTQRGPRTAADRFRAFFVTPAPRGSSRSTAAGVTARRGARSPSNATTRTAATRARSEVAQGSSRDSGTRPTGMGAASARRGAETPGRPADRAGASNPSARSTQDAEPGTRPPAQTRQRAATNSPGGGSPTRAPGRGAAANQQSDRSKPARPGPASPARPSRGTSSAGTATPPPHRSTTSRAAPARPPGRSTTSTGQPSPRMTRTGRADASPPDDPPRRPA